MHPGARVQRATADFHPGTRIKSNEQAYVRFTLTRPDHRWQHPLTRRPLRPARPRLDRTLQLRCKLHHGQRRAAEAPKRHFFAQHPDGHRRTGRGGGPERHRRRHRSQASASAARVALYERRPNFTRGPSSSRRTDADVYLRPFDGAVSDIKANSKVVLEKLALATTGGVIQKQNGFAHPEKGHAGFDPRSRSRQAQNRQLRGPDAPKGGHRHGARQRRFPCRSTTTISPSRRPPTASCSSRRRAPPIRSRRAKSR